MALQRPSPTGSNGRAAQGRFGPGNKLARGNPHAKRAQELRNALFAAVSDEDLKEVVQSLVKQAKEGNIQAAKEVLSRLLGKPENWDTQERLEELEARLGVGERAAG